LRPGRLSPAGPLCIVCFMGFKLRCMRPKWIIGARYPAHAGRFRRCPLFVEIGSLSHRSFNMLLKR